MGLEIGYAYTSFKWSNNAKGNAGVTVAVISLRNIQTESKFLYSDFLRNEVQEINGYLIAGPEIGLGRRSQPLFSGFPSMVRGSQPTDGGHLILDQGEYDELLDSAPEARKFIKKYAGASDFIRGDDRYCLWIEDEDVDDASQISPISRRLEAVARMRLESKAASTRD